jgi:hypothetical protein
VAALNAATARAGTPSWTPARSARTRSSRRSSTSLRGPAGRRAGRARQLRRPALPRHENRPALAQTFEEVATGERVTVAVNHFKSKGSACTGDPDLADGQGNCNLTRTQAAQALADWLATDPPAAGTATSWSSVTSTATATRTRSVRSRRPATPTSIEEFVGEDGYGYLFDGQLGYLDHALATPACSPR